MSQFGIQLHKASKTKNTGNGKKIIKARGKRRSEVGNYFSATKMYEKNVSKKVRRRGGKFTSVLKRAGFVNVLTSSGMKKAQIKTILESKDNRNFARQNIITKGSILSTDIGKVEVTNRPGRDGAINAKLIEAK